MIYLGKMHFLCRYFPAPTLEVMTLLKPHRIIVAQPSVLPISDGQMPATLAVITSRPLHLLSFIPVISIAPLQVHYYSEAP